MVAEARLKSKNLYKVELYLLKIIEAIGLVTGSETLA